MVSRALEGVPQYEYLYLSFSEKESLEYGEYFYRRNSERTKLTQKGLDSYRQFLSISPEGLDGEWGIHIDPVRRSLRFSAKGLMEEKGLSVVKDWLMGCNPDDWRYGKPYFEVAVSEESRDVLFLETIKDQIVILKRISLGKMSA